MSKGRTGRIDRLRVLRGWQWCALNDPGLLRAAWPRARAGLPSFPTISGKRPASRRTRRRWLADLRDQRQAAFVRAASTYAMEQHRRMETAGPEKWRRIFEEGL